MIYYGMEKLILQLEQFKNSITDQVLLEKIDKKAQEEISNEVVKEMFKHSSKEEFNKNERKIFQALSGVKTDADEKVLSNTEMLNNDSYFEMENGKFVVNRFKNEQKFDLNFDNFFKEFSKSLNP